MYTCLEKPTNDTNHTCHPPAPPTKITTPITSPAGSHLAPTWLPPGSSLRSSGPSLPLAGVASKRRSDCTRTPCKPRSCGRIGRMDAGRGDQDRAQRPRGASNVQRSLQVGEGLTFQGQEPTEPAEPSESTDEIGGPKTSTAEKSGRKRRRKSLHLRIRGMGVFEDGTRRASIELFVSEPQSFRMVCFSFRPGGRGNGKWSDRLVTCLVRSPSPSTPRCHAGGCGDTPTGPVEVSPATRDLGHPSEAMLGQIRTQTAGAMRLSFHIPLLQVFPLLKPRHREELVADCGGCCEML